jgi:NADP-dependent 3-hydroxy acid dehydrogenase YdfG
MERVVAITGASAGIGRATALRLARDGARVVVSARRGDRLETLVAEITRLGGKARAVVADVTSQDDLHAVVAAAREHFGRLDVMICNAGFGIYGRAGEIAPSEMRRMMDVNYMGTYHGIHAALPVFRAQKSGHVIVVSSIVGRRGVPFTGGYAATKFAQVGLAESIRAELAGTGIHVSLVFPVSTRTEFFAVMTRESGFATRASGPRQDATEVADAIAWTIERPVPEVYPYRKARGLFLMNAIAPAFCDRLVQKWRREPENESPDS